MNIYIKNAHIFLENKEKIHGSIYIESGKIKKIYAEQSLLDADNFHIGVRVIDATNLNLIPGFVDVHIHGANGADTMDATETALDTIAQFLPKEGTTSFLATTITQSHKNIEAALKNVASYKNKPGQAELLGVHLEGPFIEKSKAGAQPVQHIIKPDIELFMKWQEISEHSIRTVTMAPEMDDDGRFIKTLVKAGINVSAGHTAAGFTGIKKAVNYGISQLTHLCNAMTGIHHQDIGVVGAAFQLKELKAELIADGIHVVPEMLQLIYNNIGSERLILITDAMRAKGMPDGNYELGGQKAIVRDGKALLEDGTLAGSILKMCDGVKRMYTLEGVSMTDIIQMASVNPAKQIGVYDRKGSITVGKDADLLLVDDDLNIRYTFCCGEIAFRGEI
ncbi:N-acetylglucosamine-6-phosphate deacetylase [Pallidibacillus pasinlerensis]|uniref:N-acetylglucosamine-6-phosphate deacetylase n=1 Tax=Pallidibacillus pasinlerensis TaxID=2703818 RepID=A0ABX0A2T2_9BACI|nr:N-acetylglucosamine-6-phosphate deacetylase [Pallidibacillus pasinlerensis]NCU17712.1 N-acetylglucosamine-6-phosphate deacetylase [Pallidibacillus pasinlerensis]